MNILKVASVSLTVLGAVVSVATSFVDKKQADKDLNEKVEKVVNDILNKE